MNDASGNENTATNPFRRRRFLLLSAIALLGLSVVLRLWMNQPSLAEQKLVGMWRLSRTYPTDDGAGVLTDEFYIFSSDGRYGRWCIDRETRLHNKRLRQGRWHIREGNPPRLKMESDAPLLKRLLRRASRSEALIHEIGKDQFIWEVDAGPEVFDRVDSLPKEFPQRDQ